MYNALVGIIDLLPSADVGIAVIILTLLVSIIILPITLKATRTQVKMKLIEPKIKKIQEKHKDNREQQALEMLELYREEKINPLSGIFLLLIQLPFVIALYYVFARGGLPEIKVDDLYSFIPSPDQVNVFFLGLVDVTQKSILLAALAALAQFVQTHFLLSSNKKQKENEPEKEEPKEVKKSDEKKPSFQEDFAKSMNLQMRFVFPFFIGFIAYSFSGMVALYFVVRSVVTIVQEVSIKRKIRESYEKA